MARHHLIDDHLALLADRLPGSAVDELADRLTETWHHHLAAGLSPAGAADAPSPSSAPPTKSSMPSLRTHPDVGWHCGY